MAQIPVGVSHSYDPSALSRRMVQERFPDAECVPDGLMWVVKARDGQKTISHRTSSAFKAWMSAQEYVTANPPAPSSGERVK